MDESYVKELEENGLEVARSMKAFVIKIGEKENATPAELEAMSRIAHSLMNSAENIRYRYSS